MPKPSLTWVCSMAASTGDEVTSTLRRYTAEGLTARYYRCDVGDLNAVTATVARVSDELGAITAVIHGAGANVPRRVEQASVEDVRREIRPKVVGAVNLCRAVASAPPKLFVGLSSSTAVTGMPCNAWYGFANEALERTLRRFASEHAETSALAVGFSIWGDVGIAAVENVLYLGLAILFFTYMYRRSRATGQFARNEE